MTTASTPRRDALVTTVLAPGLAWLLLGPAAGLAAAGAAVWALFGTGDRARILGTAGVLTIATATSWLAAGTPTPFEVVSFVNEGGRDWIDVTGRATLALILVALALPASNGTSRRPGVRVVASRLDEADRLRAISIVTVVVIHGLPFRAPITGYIDYWLSDLLRFSVATLFFVSGWLLPSARMGATWVRRRLARVLPAYVLASVVMLSLAHVSPFIDTRPAINSLLLGDAVGPYYFVYVLVALTLVTPLLQRLSRPTLWGLLALAAAASLAIELADLPLYLHNHLPFTWLPFYLAGHLLRPLRSTIARAHDWVRATLVVTTAILALALGVLPIESTPRRAVTWITMWAVLGMLLALSLATSAVPSPLTRRLGEQSYLVYLYHPAIVASIAGAFGSSVLTLRPLTAAAVAIMTCLLGGVLARIAWPTQAGRWLGA